MINSTPWLSQIQFFLSLGFMALFLVIELGLAWVLLFFKIRSHGSRQAEWIAAYRFWVRVFALAFVLTLASSMPVLIQFGSLWPSLMDSIGEIAGPLLAVSILTTFIFKSCFLGAMLFGQRRLSDQVHTVVVFMVALGVTLSALWLIALQSWMQTPAGASFVDGQYQVVDWVGVVFNPSFGWSAGLLAVSAALTVAFLMLGVTARQTFHRSLDESERLVFKTGLAIAMAGVVFLAVASAGLGNIVARHQPAKAAATAGYWHGGTPPSVVWFAWPDANSQRNRAVLEWRDAGALWLGQDSLGRLRGLDEFSGMSPPVAFTFWSFRVMVAVGLLMGVLSWLTCLRLRKKNYDPAALSLAWRRVLSAMTFSGWLVCLSGLGYVLFGLYPYAVNGTITISEIAGSTSPDVLLGGIIAYIALYILFLAGFFQLLKHVARYGVVPIARRRGRA
ncbi:MAG TPA: cytochrome ubiquinol oxidase subunit I [Eoetvoesiella sp.]